MTPEQFARLKVGDEILVRCTVEKVYNMIAFARPCDNRPGEDVVSVCDAEIAGYSEFFQFIVGDRVLWGNRPGWFIVHLIPDTAEAIILNDAASIGPRRTALSRLTRDRS